MILGFLLLHRRFVKGMERLEMGVKRYNHITPLMAGVQGFRDFSKRKPVSVLRHR
jgi:hypothetical protein